MYVDGFPKCFEYPEQMVGREIRNYIVNYAFCMELDYVLLDKWI